MATTPSRRSGRAARLQRVARRRARAASRRPAAPIGSRPPGRRRRTPALLPPSARQPVAAGPTDGWTRIQQAAGTLAALGTLAVVLFTWLSLQQVDNEHALTREGQVTDRYNNAVNSIGDNSLEVRLGGIYALQRIMKDSSLDQPSIVNVLSTYIRHHATKPEQGAYDLEVLASDVQVALTALSDRNPSHDGPAHVNLTGTDLHGAALRGADLADADLTDANLADADLTEADLTGTHLDSANLIYANLNGADLRGTDLANADLRGADLHSADLTDALLTSASLDGADLRGADLTGADLTDSMWCSAPPAPPEGCRLPWAPW